MGSWSYFPHHGRSVKPGRSWDWSYPEFWVTGVYIDIPTKNALVTVSIFFGTTISGVEQLFLQVLSEGKGGSLGESGTPKSKEP